MVTQEHDLLGENEKHMIGLRTAITILTGWKFLLHGLPTQTTLPKCVKQLHGHVDK